MRLLLSLLVFASAACTSQVEEFPRSSTPMGVGAQEEPPDDGEDADSGEEEEDTGDASPPEDTG